MASRLELQTFLETIAPNVYFQPPSSLNYPCIKYEVNDIKDTYADDTKYISKTEYLLTIMDKDPDSVIVEKIKQLKASKFVRGFVKDNLNHTLFTMFY